MTTGIIYLAKNTISNKCYVGKTTRTLEQRKKEHYWQTIKAEYKFGRALQKYKESDWVWSILAEVPVEELDDYEIFFINDLDTYKKGYNTHIGGDWFGNNNPRKNKVIYELWHPEHGIIRETLAELQKRDSCFFTHFSELVKGNRHHINGYVLLKNKDNYENLVRTYNFYHPQIGVVNCTTKELFNTYREHFNSKENYLHTLTNGRVLIHFGWVLAENKDRYDDLSTTSTNITLSHPEHGTLTLRRSEFREKYGLLDSAMTCLKNGKYKSSKGWTYTNKGE